MRFPVLAAAASLLLLAAQDSPAEPFTQIEDTMWECGGTVAAQVSVKGAGTMKATGTFENSPCDLWKDDFGAQAFLGLTPVTFPTLPDGDNTAGGYLVLDPGTFKRTTVKATIVTANVRDTVGQLCKSLYELLSESGIATVPGDSALKLPKIDRTTLGDVTLDADALVASATWTAVKKFTMVKVSGSVRFSGTFTSGPYQDRTFKGKLVIKATGVPSVPPG